MQWRHCSLINDACKVKFWPPHLFSCLQLSSFCTVNTVRSPCVYEATSAMAAWRLWRPSRLAHCGVPVPGHSSSGAHSADCSSSRSVPNAYFLRTHVPTWGRATAGSQRRRNFCSEAGWAAASLCVATSCVVVKRISRPRLPANVRVFRPFSELHADAILLFVRSCRTPMSDPSERRMAALSAVSAG